MVRGEKCERAIFFFFSMSVGEKLCTNRFLLPRGRPGCRSQLIEAGGVQLLVVFDHTRSARENLLCCLTHLGLMTAAEGCEIPRHTTGSYGSDVGILRKQLSHRQVLPLQLIM